MSKQIVIMLFTLVLGMATAFSQQESWSWREYVYPDEGFAITLPRRPVAPHKDANNPNITVYTVAFTNDSALTLRVVNEQRNCTATLRQLKEGALNNKQPRQPTYPSSVNDVSIDGHPGLEYEFKLGPDRNTYDRYYCVNGTFYIFSVVWPSMQPRPAAANRAIKSFRILTGGTSHN